MGTPLEICLEELYNTFQHYPFNPNMERCNHCIDDGELRAIGDVPLRDIGAEFESLLVSNLLLTVGGIPDFKHFLPRLLEIYSVESHEATLYPEMLFSRLSVARWWEWEAKERAAVQAFIEAYWEDRLSGFPAKEEVDSFACSVGITGVAIRPLVSRGCSLKGTAPEFHLATFIDLELPNWIAKGVLGNPFWEGHQDQAKTLMDSILRTGSWESLNQAIRDPGAEPKPLLISARDKLERALKTMGRFTSHA